MIVAKLWATVVVRESHDGIYPFSFRFTAQAFGQLSDDAVNATYSRDNPDFISYADITIFTAVTFKSEVFMRDIQSNLSRMVGILQQSGKISLDIRFIHPVSLFFCHTGMTDRVAVLDYVLAFCKIF